MERGTTAKAVEEKKVENEECESHSVSHEIAHLPDLTGGDPVRNYEAKDDNAKRRQPDRPFWPKKIIQNEREQQSDGHRCNRADEDECQLRAHTARSSSQIA